MSNKKAILKYIYFIGIGGIGISALARYFLASGSRISGSDASQSIITQELKKEGVEVKIGHKTNNVPRNITLAIHSAAIALDNNPEIKKIKKLGDIPIKSYAQAIGELTRDYKTIAITGSHGKSTTTALLALVLKDTHFDPTVIIGTKLKEFGGSNFRKGKSNYLILEADEYQESFLHYSPIAVIITNIDREHLDFFKNLNEIKKVFLKFINNIQLNGILILNKDDKNLFNLRNKIQKIAKKNNLKMFWFGAQEKFKSDIQEKLKKCLKVPGEHNFSNALAAYALSRAFKINSKIILNMLGKYRGAWRRMEYRGKLKNSIINGQKLIINSFVFDDYAHHPTEIKATLLGLRQKYPKSKIICVFQPHQAERLKLLFKEFSQSFYSADALILLSIYKVVGRDFFASKYSSQKLAEIIKKRKTSPPVTYLKDFKNLPKTIKIILNSKSCALNSVVIVMMGAGDIYKHTNFLLSYNSKK